MIRGAFDDGKENRLQPVMPRLTDVGSGSPPQDSGRAPDEQAEGAAGRPPEIREFRTVMPRLTDAQGDPPPRGRPGRGGGSLDGRRTWFSADARSWQFSIVTWAGRAPWRRWPCHRCLLVCESHEKYAQATELRLGFTVTGIGLAMTSASSQASVSPLDIQSCSPRRPPAQRAQAIPSPGRMRE